MPTTAVAFPARPKFALDRQDFETWGEREDNCALASLLDAAPLPAALAQWWVDGWVLPIGLQAGAFRAPVFRQEQRRRAHIASWDHRSLATTNLASLATGPLGQLQIFYLAREGNRSRHSRAKPWRLKYPDPCIKPPKGCARWSDARQRRAKATRNLNVNWTATWRFGTFVGTVTHQMLDTLLVSEDA